MSTRNRIKAVAALILAIVSTGALTAQGALATTWTDSSALKSGESRALKQNMNAMGVSVLGGTVSGTLLSITATGLEIVSGRITQTGSAAEISGQIMFTGLHLSEPAGCSPPASITTSLLAGEVFVSGGVTYLRLKPVSGGTLATVTLTGKCAIAGAPFKITTGNYICMKTNPVGTMAVTHFVEMNSAVLSGCGGSLAAAGNPANLVAEGTLEVESGLSWGAN